MKRVTIYDVAKEAGVSLATVSRVINGFQRCKAPTKERVEAAEKLAINQRDCARSCVTRSQLLSVWWLVPEASFTYTGQVINAFD